MNKPNRVAMLTPTPIDKPVIAALYIRVSTAKQPQFDKRRPNFSPNCSVASTIMNNRDKQWRKAHADTRSY